MSPPRPPLGQATPTSKGGRKATLAHEGVREKVHIIICPQNSEGLLSKKKVSVQIKI
jgi:hypothetical protein